MAPRGTSRDRLAILEARVLEMEKDLRASRLQAGSNGRWPAAGRTAEAIASGDFGWVQLVNQFNGSDAGKVKAKNPYQDDIATDTFVSVHIVDGVLLILTGDCPA